MEIASSVQAGKIVPRKQAYRIDSIDLLRGIVMIIMALDHTRDLLHVQAFTGDPLNLQTTTPLLFFTRWITHFCAPVFVFLSGTSIYLQSLRKTKNQLAIFLLKRGAWLIFIEWFIMTLGITFDFHYSIIVLQVIWAIGISMILLSLIIWLPFKAVFITGLIIVFGHNILDFLEINPRAPFPFIYSLIHRPAIIPLTPNHALGIFYPFLPWTGVMILGYCFGSVYRTDIVDKKRKRTIALIGVLLISLFIILRFTNVYGDPLHWSIQRNNLYTLLSFINCQKYPPSLLYLCMTIGPALVFLASIGDHRNVITNIITVYGRVPFLYYLLHFYILHTISAFAFLSRGHSVAEGMKGVTGLPFKFIIPGEGYRLAIVYAIWLGVVILLYPVCKWFSEYKGTHKKWWLSYL